MDECSGDSNPCNLETEVCHNLVGSHICKCKEGLIKSSEGVCLTEDQLPPEERPKKVKKKKKSKKGKTETQTTTDPDKPHYPWYYVIGPLTVLYIVKRFCQPNLVTSAGFILIVALTATLSPE